MNAATSEFAQPAKSTLAGLTQGHRLKYTFAVLLSTSATMVMLAVPIIGKHALNVIVEKDFEFASILLLQIGTWVGVPESFVAYLILSAVAGVLLTAASMSCQFGRDRLSAVASEGIAQRLREALYERLHHVPMKFYDEAETGDLVQRCSSDIETVRVFMHADVDEAGQMLLFLAGMVPVLFWHQAELSWFAFLMIPVLFFSAYFFFKSITQLFQVTDESEGALTAVIQENLTGIRVVRAFARHEFETERFDIRNQAFRDNYLRLYKLMAYYWSGTDFLAMFQIGLVLFAGSYFYLVGKINIGELFLFMMYVTYVVWRIRHVGRLIADGGKAVVALRRINFILQSHAETEQRYPPQTRILGDIEFKHVTVRFDAEQAALHDVSVHIRAGETIGIVGRPGSGKSTILRALLRIHDVDEGQILVDGLDIADVNRKWLRTNVGVVLQEPFLYSRTVQENLVVGNQYATANEIRDASKEAAIHDAIEQFTDGYQSVIGERGVTLSGGQRQRIALARALLKNPPILILDDALSAVDSNTEEHILNSLAERRGKHTSFIVAHRLSTLRNVDRVLVFDEGRLVQVGTHEELNRQPGPYHELCALQNLMDESIRIEAFGRG
ncbi:MAG: ABC transporter ATP-binding protein [Gammaproteobacteria bacterium]|nr:ABC transporter ATP-binding protein [Gammaproteobacteria bacterium]